MLSSVQIIGLPPPEGVAIELRGTLYATPLLPDGSELPRLVVSTGRLVAAIPSTPHQPAAKKEWGGVALYDPPPGTYEFEQMRSAAQLTTPCVLGSVRLWLRSLKAPATDRGGAYEAAMRLCPRAYVDTLTRLGAPDPVPQAMALIGQEVDLDFDLLRSGVLPLY